MSISLLPNDLRGNEEKAKEEAKKRVSAPVWRMHNPQSQATNGLKKANGQVKPNLPDIEIGAQNSLEKKGVFKVISKEDKIQIETPKIKENRDDVPIFAAQKSEKPVFKPFHQDIVRPVLTKKEEPTVVSAPRVDKHGAMHLPDKEKSGNGFGSKIISQTDYVLREASKPMSLWQLLLGRNALKKLQNPPAQVNLVQEDYATVLHREFWRRAYIFMLIIFVFTAMASGAYLYFRWLYLDLVKQYNANFDTITKNSNLLQEKILSFKAVKSGQKRVEQVASLLESRVHWAKLFDFLEHETAAGVTYTNFSAGADKVTLQGKAASFTDLAKQLKLFENSPAVEKAYIGGGVLQTVKEMVEAGEPDKKGQKSLVEKTSVYVEFYADLNFKEGFLSAP